MTTYDQQQITGIHARLDIIINQLDGLMAFMEHQVAKTPKSTPPSLQSDGNKVQQPSNADRKPGGKSPRGGK